MPTFIILSKQVFPPGINIPAERPITPNTSLLKVSADRNTWPTGPCIRVQVDMSYDNGDTWISPFAAFTADGGEAIGRTGITSTSSVLIPLPDPSNPQRRGRVEVEFLQSIDTEIRLELT